MNDEQDGLAEVIAFPGFSDSNAAAPSDRKAHLARLRAKMLETEAEHAPEPPRGEPYLGTANQGEPRAEADLAPRDQPPGGDLGATEPIRRAFKSSGRRPSFAPTEGGEAARSGRSIDRGTSTKRATKGASTGGPKAPRTNVSRMPGLTEHAEQDTQAASDLLVRALGRSAKSVSEAEALLAEQTELGAREREQIINRMVDLGYLDDAALAEQLMAGALSRKGLGRTGMSRELRKRGIDDSIIQDALGDFDRDDEFDRALELAQDRASRLRGLDYETAQRRLYGYLARRGFSGDIVGRAVKEALR